MLLHKAMVYLIVIFWMLSKDILSFPLCLLYSVSMTPLSIASSVCIVFPCLDTKRGQCELKIV